LSQILGIVLSCIEEIRLHVTSPVYIRFIFASEITNKTTIIMDTKKKTSMMLSIGKAASYYIKHYDEINKNSNPFDHINPYYNPFTR